MPHPLPSQYLECEIFAFPFSSLPAYQCGTLSLCSTKYLTLDKNTQSLADQLDEFIRPRALGHSLESIRTLRDSIWFTERPQSRSLAQLLHHCALDSLEAHGPDISLKFTGACAMPTPQRIEHFRWLSLALPDDLLVAARYANIPCDPPADHINASTPLLQKLLHEKPVADTHLHLGAAFPFSLLWTSLMASIAHNPPEIKAKSPFNHYKKHFAQLLSAAALCRLIMASFLWRKSLVPNHDSFSIFLSESNALGTIAERLQWPFGHPDAYNSLLKTLRTLRGAQPSMELARTSSLLRHLYNRPAPRSPQSLLELMALDPLSDWLAPKPQGASPETRLAQRALRYLLNEGQNDSAFAAHFWQYTRLRNITFRWLTQERGTAGLDWFTLYYERIKSLRNKPILQKVRFEAALALESSGVALGALEARSAPECNWHEIRNEVQDIAKCAMKWWPHPGQPRPEIGLTLHFLKESCHSHTKKPHADPRQIAHGLRFGAYAHKKFKECIAIEGALQANPEILLVLRGIDIASTELAVPTWTLLPIFQRVRKASHTASARLAHTLPRGRITPMRVTCHAGEDYRRLSEGIRHIHEWIEFGAFQEGDRLGHALALGENPIFWAMEHGTTTQPAEERLDDLLWELDRYGKGCLPAEAGRLEQVRREALTLAEGIYRDASLSPDLLIEARRLRHNARFLDDLGYPFLGRLEPRDRAAHLAYRYLTDAGVYVRGQRSERIASRENETRMLIQAQSWLARLLNGMEITVESNPSSNMLIGDMHAMERHPSLRMQPLSNLNEASPKGIALPLQSRVMLSLNDDDPLTFATSLGREYVFVYGALLSAGATSEQALAWLRDRRDDAYRSRFTLPPSAEPEFLAALTKA